MKIKTVLFILLTCVLTSCKKDYQCACETLYGNNNYTIHNTKKKADEQCKATATFDGHCSLK
jgi:hypothetical protein